MSLEKRWAGFAKFKVNTWLECFWQVFDENAAKSELNK